MFLLLMMVEPNYTQMKKATSPVVPLGAPRAGQWVERVQGDPDKPNEPFVVRIHADEGYIVLPHTHVVDENIVVIQGQWALGMGGKFDRQSLEEIGVGGFALAPKNMAHFAWSKTESTIQVH